MKKGIAFVLTVALLATLATGCASSMTVAEPTIEPVLSATAEPTVQQDAAQEEAVSIVDAKVNENGELILYMSNNTTINAGLVRGEDGKDGVDGLNGADGKDGVNGKNGRDGVDGKDGADGKDGRDGTDGTNGRDGVDGKDGKDGKDGQNASSGDSRKIELKNDGTNVCWRYEGDSEWQTLVSLADITGKDGKDGAPGKDGADGKDGKDGIDGAPGKDGADGKDGKDGIDGVDGKPGADGKDGADGQPGADGREVELRTTETHIQWRYVGDTEWKDLIALSEITGPKGDKGDKGDKGNSPYIGENGNWWVGDQDTGVKAEAGKEQPEFFFNETGEILLAYNGTRNIVTVPEGVKKIAATAFYGNEHLEKINLPISIKFIGEESFANCSQLREIAFFNTVNKPEDIIIGDGAFKKCASLKSFTLYRCGEILVNEDAFSESGLETVVLCGTKVDIASRAFKACDKLYDFNIKHNVYLEGYNAYTSIEKIQVRKQAFEDCKALEKVVMCQWIYNPRTEIILENGAFTNCPSLYAFIANSDNTIRGLVENKPFVNCPKLRKYFNNHMKEYLDENGELYPEAISPAFGNKMQRSVVQTITDKCYDTVAGTLNSEGRLVFGDEQRTYTNRIYWNLFYEQAFAKDWDQCGNKEKYLVVGIKGFDREFMPYPDEFTDVNINGQYFELCPRNSINPREIDVANFKNKVIRSEENGETALYFVLEAPEVYGTYDFPAQLTITIRTKTTGNEYVTEMTEIGKFRIY